MAFGGPRSSCVRPGAHSAQRQDSRKDLTPCRMALHFVSTGAHAPHSDETLGLTATRGSSHSARRLRSLAFLCSSNKLESYTIGRPRKNDLRELLNAIFYLNKTGCPWRYLPKDFPPYKLVNYYYNKWTDNRLPEKVNTVLRQRLRKKRPKARSNGSNY